MKGYVENLGLISFDSQIGNLMLIYEVQLCIVELMKMKIFTKAGLLVPAIKACIKILCVLMLRTFKEIDAE